MKVVSYSRWSLNTGSVSLIKVGLVYQKSGLLKQVVSNTGLTVCRKDYSSCKVPKWGLEVETKGSGGLPRKMFKLKTVLDGLWRQNCLFSVLAKRTQVPFRVHGLCSPIILKNVLSLVLLKKTKTTFWLVNTGLEHAPLTELQFD